MNPLYIEPNEDTPEVSLDKEKGIFDFSGRSLPEDILQFYNPIYDWLRQYVDSPNEVTNVLLKIDYFNSASHKAINEILELFAEILPSGNEVIINWHYLEDDEDMYESGQDFQELTGLKFVYKSYNVE